MVFNTQKQSFDSKLFILNKSSTKLNELKQIIESPNLFISEHFNIIRNSVDLESETLLLDRKNVNTYKKQQEISKVREVMIERINLFEKEYLTKGDNKLPANIVVEAKTLIGTIENELLHKKSGQELEIIEKLLDSEIHKLKKILLKNKSILFLKKQSNIEDQDASFGKLIFMNQYLSDNAMDTFLE